MLVLTAKRDDRIRIGDNIEILIIYTADSRVRIGIEAPRELRIERKPNKPGTGDAAGTSEAVGTPEAAAGTAGPPPLPGVAVACESGASGASVSSSAPSRTSGQSGDAIVSGEPGPPSFALSPAPSPAAGGPTPATPTPGPVPQESRSEAARSEAARSERGEARNGSAGRRPHQQPGARPPRRIPPPEPTG
jgi:carbon storage regulator